MASGPWISIFPSVEASSVPTLVRTASTYQVDKMFVPIVTLGLLGVTLTALLRVVERWLAPWTAVTEQD